MFFKQKFIYEINKNCKQKQSMNIKKTAVLNLFVYSKALTYSYFIVWEKISLNENKYCHKYFVKIFFVPRIMEFIWTDMHKHFCLKINFLFDLDDFQCEM